MPSFLSKLVDWRNDEEGATAEVSLILGLDWTMSLGENIREGVTLGPIDLVVGPILGREK